MTDKLDELRRTIAELAGEDPETWPSHGNAALAIAASYALLRNECVAMKAARDKLAVALDFYANPAVYAPHPHGLAFERRDLSYRAKNALIEASGTPTPEEGLVMTTYQSNKSDVLPAISPALDAALDRAVPHVERILAREAKRRDVLAKRAD